MIVRAKEFVAALDGFRFLDVCRTPPMLQPPLASWQLRLVMLLQSVS